jgi:hypothetical protein
MNCLRRTWPSPTERCCQLRRLEEAIQQKRPGRRHGVILQHGKTRTQTANMTKVAIWELNLDILPHPPYSPDLSPSDYHLFRCLSSNLRGVSFNDDAELQNWLYDFFAGRPANFFKHGFEYLPKRLGDSPE